MVIVSLTDLHGRDGTGHACLKLAAEADLVIVTGDITSFRGADAAREVLKPIFEVNQNILAVAGNCDRTDVNYYLDTLGIDLNAACRVIGNVAFYGLAGSPTTPFGTPQEYLDETLAQILDRVVRDPTAEYHVLVSHAPPFGTVVDQVSLGSHAGSRAVRSFIERFKPDLCLCGHIHEAIGKDRLGPTLLINPGPYPNHCARIEITDRITCNLF
jgi:Icc-related predicted phosphoesterase